MITLEPAGQLEWSSRPQRCLADLEKELDAHLAVLRDAGPALGINWLDLALDPDYPVEEMPWMPKARYAIMKPYLGRRGGLAHRMMTQTASIQCAFDYADPEDWRRKFLAGSLLAPVATVLFANSSRIDGVATTATTAPMTRIPGTRRRSAKRDRNQGRLISHATAIPTAKIKPKLTGTRWLESTATGP